MSAVLWLTAAFLAILALAAFFLPDSFWDGLGSRVSQLIWRDVDLTNKDP
jgi:lauroyl/myristoyl acyltransferase